MLQGVTDAESRNRRAGGLVVFVVLPGLFQGMGGMATDHEALQTAQLFMAWTRACKEAKSRLRASGERLRCWSCRMR